MSDLTADPAGTADLETRFRIGTAARRLSALAVGDDHDGTVVPDGEALKMFDTLVELAETVGASLAHQAAGPQAGTPGDNVATGAELARILAVATTAVAGYQAAVRGDDDMPDLAGLLGLNTAA